MTVSALLVRQTDGGLAALAHRHKTLPHVLQVGGHVEHTENPWAALAHELAEESGYDLWDLDVLQPYDPSLVKAGAGRHLPIPATIEDCWVSPEHFHTDLRYAVVADEPPTRPPADDESQDLRWYTLDQLAADPDVPPGLVADYRLVMTALWTSWTRYPAVLWCADAPVVRP